VETGGPAIFIGGEDPQLSDTASRRLWHFSDFFTD
jgi:hypothetical protein